jgi:hypothetical protein
MRASAQIVNRLDAFDSTLEAISHNFATLQWMIENFGDRLQVATVSELAERKVIFVEDGNHGENRPRQDEFAASGIAFLRPPDLKGGHVDFKNCGRINEAGFQRVRKGIGKRGDIILTHRATVGRILQSNRQGAALLHLAQQQDMRVLLVGDVRQHVSVEAGDFLRVLETHSQLGRCEVTEIRRQENAPAYKAAVERMASGDARGGLDALDVLGWIREDGADYLERAADDCMRLTRNGTDLESVLVVSPILLTFAHHRDAIAFGFLKPEVKIHPNGEIEVDQQFYAEMFSKYLSRRSDSASDKAAESYDKHFESRQPLSAVESEDIDKKIARLNAVFEPEFGFSIEKLIKIMEVWREFALKAKASGGQLTEAEFVGLLCEGCDFSPTEAGAFLDRLTLPIRKSWDGDLPPRCKKEDVFPWRFRRNLSLLVRPLVQVSVNSRIWVISAPFFETSASYLTGNVEAADFPERFFASEKMRKYVGQEVNRRGHIFAEKVYTLFVENHFTGRLEIEMTELGAAKGDGLGDVDVLAWNQTTGQIFTVECKRLLAALSVREVIQRLEDFRGDKKAKDSLGRHLRRVDWLVQNLSALTKLTGIATEKIQLIPILVTSDIVPMQFFQEMKFPPEQVVPFDELAAYLAR